MYERSAIVLERYLDKLFGFNKEKNLKDSFFNFKDLIEEIKEYKSMVTEEEKVLRKFDDIAKEIRAIQRLQEKLSLSNQKLEDERNKAFNAIDDNPNTIQTKLEKIEEIVQENNEQLKRLREDYIRAFVIFIEREKDRSKCSRNKKDTEANHISNINRIIRDFKGIAGQDVQRMKSFIDSDKQAIKINIIDTMIKNGKNEKVAFDEKVISEAVDVRINISKEEAICYLVIYEKLRKLLIEMENDNLRIEKYEKVLRDVSVKLAFLKAEKEYIVEFLDNERMTAMAGTKAHQKMMEKACEDFELDIEQINNLYELILKEIAGKSTKRAYNELYNKNYLKDIQEKELSFERELTSIRLNMGAVINSNYWRIEGIKNVYEVFQKEVTDKFDKDLSDYKLEEIADESIKFLKTKDELEEEERIKNEFEKYYREHSQKYKENKQQDNKEDESYDEEDYKIDYIEEKQETDRFDNKEEYEDDYVDEEEYDKEDFEDNEFLSIISKLDNKYDEKGRYVKNKRGKRFKDEDIDFENEKNQGIFNKFFGKDKKDF